MNVVTIAGKRAEWVQSAALSPVLRSRHQETLIHTGEQDGYYLSQLFFDQLDLPTPEHRLTLSNIGQAGQLAEMRLGIAAVLRNVRPDFVLVYSDSQSAMAGALAAATLGIPIVHVGAGARVGKTRHRKRNHQRSTAEMNRVAIDQMASLNLCITQSALQNLVDEGQYQPAAWVGDLLCDAAAQYRLIAQHSSSILRLLDVGRGRYTLVTLHKPENIADSRQLIALVAALNALDDRVIFPMHPRTRRALQALQVGFADHVWPIEPVSYLDMLTLLENARIVATDSNSLQREAYVLGVPCLTLLDDTEWVETVKEGANTIIGTQTDTLLQAWDWERENGAPVGGLGRRPVFGEGQAAHAIIDAMEQWQAQSVRPVTIKRLKA